MPTSITVKVTMRLAFAWKNMEKIIFGSIVFPKMQVKQDHRWKGFHLCNHVTLMIQRKQKQLKDAIVFFFMVVKKQNMNLIGHLLLDYLKDRQFIGPLQLLDERCKTWRFGCWKDYQWHWPTFFWELYTSLEWFTKSLACELWYHFDSQVSRRVLFMDQCSKWSETTLLHQL